MAWMGIDVGTGGTRALLVNEKGKLIAGFTAPHEEIRMERPFWAEQRPEDWWNAVQKAIRGVLASAGISGSEVKGIGLSGQMHGLVLLDKDHQVIRPALIWCDQRSQPQVDRINAKVGEKRIVELIANPVLTGFTLPKLLWVRDHEPANYEKARKLLLPKDYARFMLTGEFAMDVADASGTALFDVVNRRWSEELRQDLDIDASLLPPTMECVELAGKVSKTAAALTGLAEGIPVVAGAGDQAASAVGNGIVEPGAVSCTIGTSGVVFAHMEEAAYDPKGRVHTFCHAVPGKWHVMGVTQGAGLSLQWFRNQLAAGVTYDSLTAEAALAPPGCQGLIWLPYLMGERTPHLDAGARGGWIGLTARHTRADLIRAVIEGVTYSLQECLEIIEELGAPVASVTASGGGGSSAFWRQMLADAFEKQVNVLATQEGSAYGAALLSLAGTGEFESVTEVCREAIECEASVTPRPYESRIYRSAFEVYRAVYPALRPIFRLQNALG
ncbi:MAG: xylulokinase [Bryobacterales bacterium]|nr:xylulokinase [Bryobacterales bacterium]